MKVHYRAYDYPLPVSYVVSQCTRRVPWANSTDYPKEVTCLICLEWLQKRKLA